VFRDLQALDEIEFFSEVEVPGNILCAELEWRDQQGTSVDVFAIDPLHTVRSDPFPHREPDPTTTPDIEN
jgi:hypothetical protein